MENPISSAKTFLTSLENTLKLPFLKTVRLNNNTLSGLMSSFFQSPDVQTIDLSFNKYSGAIPFLNLPKLTSINLSQNMFTGTLPEFTSPKLDTLYLHNNLLMGCIPRSYDSLCKNSLADVTLLTMYLP